MKRTLSSTNFYKVSEYTRSKKRKLWDMPLPKREVACWVSATKTRNFILNDTLVDWFTEHKVKKRFNKFSNKNGFVSFIMEKGIEFESKIVKYINYNKIPVVTVSEYITNESVKKTIELMKKGTPIIHSAPVRNYKNHTHGIIDFLVRSDHLHKLINECPLTIEEQIIKAPNLGTDYHYVVIDVKFSTLPLRADGRHLLNSGCYPAYKAQLSIYNDAIGIIQGYTSQYAFILGRRWKYTSKDIKYENFTCLDKLGVIDYKTIDNYYIDRTTEAIKWIKENKKYGSEWGISPPSRIELYPNMSHDSGKWQIDKKILAEEIGEISSVWYCGIKQRDIALKNGITSWKNPECNSKNMGIYGKRASIIDSILDINRQDVDKIRPKTIINNIHNWKDIGNEMFVDFETLSDISIDFNKLPFQNTTDMIFMIGVWYKKDLSWEYKRFTCNKSTYEEEYRIMDEFSVFIKKNGNPKLWYWCAEKRFWSRSEKRQFDFSKSCNDETKINNISDNWEINNWTDLCDVFKKEPIVIKDCFKFGLKPIANCMKKHGFITTKIESECDSGMSAMVKALKCYELFSNPANCSIMQDIATYNKFDCKVLYDIIDYLRKNHV